MEEQQEEGKKRRVVLDSLGWLTESTILPKKHRVIEGVGASSILELKAQLYKSQEESKKSKDISGSDVNYHRAKKKITLRKPFSNKNSGVESRALKDKLELKAVKDGAASYAALEKKAELYEKLMKGELSDEEEKEKYCVDFFRKGGEQEDVGKGRNDDSYPAASSVRAAEGGDGNIDDADADRFNVNFAGLGRNDGAFDNDEHKRFVREVHVEANQAREKASEVKLRRQDQAAARREKIRQAYLRKKLEKVKATLSGAEQPGPAPAAAGGGVS